LTVSVTGVAPVQPLSPELLPEDEADPLEPLLPPDVPDELDDDADPEEDDDPDEDDDAEGPEDADPDDVDAPELEPGESSDVASELPELAPLPDPEPLAVASWPPPLEPWAASSRAPPSIPVMSVMPTIDAQAVSAKARRAAPRGRPDRTARDISELPRDAEARLSGARRRRDDEPCRAAALR
jgi:hypothetical protein